MDGPCSGSSSSLPKNSELSTEQLRFLDQHFKAPEDLFHGASHHLLTTLLRDCSNLETHILHLHTSLARRTVSWISRSFAAKNSLHNLNLDLQNLSLLTTQRLYSVNSVFGFLINLSSSFFLFLFCCSFFEFFIWDYRWDWFEEIP